MTEVNAYDGKGAWSESLATGLRILEGGEKLTIISQTLPYMFSPEKFYDKIEFVEEVTFNGTKCSKLKFTKEGLDPYTGFYDTKTNLVIAEERVLPTAMGKIKVTMSYSNYLKHEKGFKYPATMTQAAGPTKIEAKVKEITINPAIDDKIFAAPAQ